MNGYRYRRWGISALLASALFSLSLGCRAKSHEASQAHDEVATKKNTAQADTESVLLPSTPERKSPPKKSWPLFRGDRQATGHVPSRLAPPLKIAWEFELDDDAFENSPIVADEKVFLASSDGLLLALNLEDGKERWRYKTEVGFTASPSFHQGRIFIGDVDGYVYCFNATDGQLIWKCETKEEITAAANVEGNRVLVASQDGTLYCLNAEDGQEIWRYQSEDQLRSFPTIAQRRVLLGGCNGELIAVDLDSGKPLRNVDLGAPTGSTAAVGGNLAFLGTEGKSFWAIDYLAGKVAWEYTADKRAFPFRSSAAVTDSLVIVGSRDKRLHALDRTSGRPVWLFSTQGRVDGSLIVLDDVVYVGSADERLYALDIKTGKELWRFELGGTVLGSPAFADGRLLVITDDGQVMCFVTE